MRKAPPALTGAAAAALPALAAGLANIALLAGHPLFWHPVVDARWHHLWACLVSSGDILAYAPYFRAPLYPLLLGCLYSATGPSVLAGALLSCALHAFSASLLYLAASMRVSRGWALAIAVCWGLWGTAIAYSSTLLIEPLYIVLLLSSFLLLDGGRVGAGLLVLGLAATARPGALVVLPALLVVIRPARILRGLPLLAAPVAAVWLVNAVSGDPCTVLSSQGGINFYLGNGPEADGFTAFAPAAVPGDASGRLPYRDNVETASIALAPQGLRPSGVSAWWTRRTVLAVCADPLRALGLLGRKAALLCSTVEVPCNYDCYYLGRYSPVLSVLLVPPPAGLPMILLWALLPGALLAGRPSRREWMLLAWILLLAAGTVAFFVTGRFRLPIVPFALLLLATRAVRAGRRALLAAPAGIAAGVLATIPWGGVVETSGVNMPFHDAVAHYEQGRPDEARALFMEALARSSARSDSISLNRAETMFDLAVLEAGAGRRDRALMWLEALEAEYPGYLSRMHPGEVRGNAGPPGWL